MSRFSFVFSPLLFHLSSHFLLYYLVYLSPPCYIHFPPSLCFYTSVPLLVILPAPPRPSPQSHLICLQSVWLIYHCSEILKSLLPLVLRRVHLTCNTCMRTHNVNYSVSKDSTTLRILSFQSLLLAFRDWQTAHGMLTNSAPLRPLRYMYAVRKTFGIWAWVTASQWYICLFLNTN